MAIFLIVIILFLLLPTEYCDGLYNEQSIEYYNRAVSFFKTCILFRSDRYTFLFCCAAQNSQ